MALKNAFRRSIIKLFLKFKCFQRLIRRRLSFYSGQYQKRIEFMNQNFIFSTEFRSNDLFLGPGNRNTRVRIIVRIFIVRIYIVGLIIIREAVWQTVPKYSIGSRRRTVFLKFRDLTIASNILIAKLFQLLIKIKTIMKLKRFLSYELTQSQPTHIIKY